MQPAQAVKAFYMLIMAVRLLHVPARHHTLIMALQVMQVMQVVQGMRSAHRLMQPAQAVKAFYMLIMAVRLLRVPARHHTLIMALQVMRGSKHSLVKPAVLLFEIQTEITNNECLPARHHTLVMALQVMQQNMVTVVTTYAESQHCCRRHIRTIIIQSSSCCCSSSSRQPSCRLTSTIESITVRLLSSCPGAGAALPAVLCSCCCCVVPAPGTELSQPTVLPAGALVLLWLL
jgi:hypothetical protein